MNIRVPRWLSAGLFSCAIVGAIPAFADTAELATSSAVTYHPASIHLAGPLQPSNRPTARGMLRLATYVLQALDASSSARALRVAGRHEDNAMLRPFAHGGVLTMDLGFALGDIVRDFAIRRSSESVQISADALQAASNLAGMLQTNANGR